MGIEGMIKARLVLWLLVRLIIIIKIWGKRLILMMIMSRWRSLSMLGMGLSSSKRRLHQSQR
jgi:hypothetical protein